LRLLQTRECPTGTLFRHPTREGVGKKVGRKIRKDKKEKEKEKEKKEKGRRNRVELVPYQLFSI
jgi:hypothetical protein